MAPRGSLFATPIINQPQAGILGAGAIQKRPVVISQSNSLLPDADDYLAIRPMVYLSFSFDHRILDGAEADRFLATVVQFLEHYSGDDDHKTVFVSRCSWKEYAVPWLRPENTTSSSSAVGRAAMWPRSGPRSWARRLRSSTVSSWAASA